MGQYNVVHGTVVQGGQPLGYGAALELTVEQAKHMNKHGTVVVPSADFEKLAKKLQLEKELADDKEKARLAGKRKAKAPEPDEDEDESDEDDSDEERESEDDEVVDQAAPTPPPAPAAPAKGKAKAKKNKAAK